MKILLLLPNSKNIVRSIPLGLLYLAASLKEAGFCDIKIIDARRENLSERAITRQFVSFAPDVVGISGLSLEAPEVHALARLAKQADARCKVVVGGAYATSSPDHIMQDPNIDFAVIGEGERTLCNLIHALEHNEDVRGIDGLACRLDGRPLVNLPKTVIEDIDSLPFPSWHLIDMERYFHGVRRHSVNPLPFSDRIVPVFTSRGCPYGCIYCHNIFGKKVRLRSAQKVVEEIELLIRRYNVREVEVVDDIFNFDLPRAKQICDEIIRRGIKIKISFPNGLRADRMDEELIAKLKQAGTHLVYYAIESASPQVQRRIGKNLDLDKARRVIEQTVRRDIITCCFFMLGFPGETRKEMLQTIRFAKELPLHIADFFYVTPQPNTPLFNEFYTRHLGSQRLTGYHFSRLSPDLNVSLVPSEELRSIWARAFREFYFRPRQMWRIWKAVPNKIKIFRNALFILRHAVANNY